MSNSQSLNSHSCGLQDAMWVHGNDEDDDDEEGRFPSNNFFRKSKNNLSNTLKRFDRTTFTCIH